MFHPKALTAARSSDAARVILTGAAPRFGKAPAPGCHQHQAVTSTCQLEEIKSFTLSGFVREVALMGCPLLSSPLLSLCRATLTAAPGDSSHAGTGGTHFKWIHRSDTVPEWASNLGNSLHQRPCAVLRYREQENPPTKPLKNTQRLQEQQLAPLDWVPHTGHFF